MSPQKLLYIQVLTEFWGDPSHNISCEVTLKSSVLLWDYNLRANVEAFHSGILKGRFEGIKSSTRWRLKVCQYADGSWVPVNSVIRGLGMYDRAKQSIHNNSIILNWCLSSAPTLVFSPSETPPSKKNATVCVATIAALLFGVQHPREGTTLKAARKRRCNISGRVLIWLAQMHYARHINSQKTKTPWASLAIKIYLEVVLHHSASFYQLREAARHK